MKTPLDTTGAGNGSGVGFVPLIVTVLLLVGPGGVSIFT